MLEYQSTLGWNVYIKFPIARAHHAAIDVAALVFPPSVFRIVRGKHFDEIRLAAADVDAVFAFLPTRSTGVDDAHESFERFAVPVHDAFKRHDAVWAVFV